MKKTLLPFCFAILSSLISSVLIAQAGKLDPSFGDSGKVSTSSHQPSRSYASALQKDGKITLAGATGYFDQDPLQCKFYLCRYQKDGRRDKGFGTDGRIEENLYADIAIIKDVAIKADGRIIVAGYYQQGQEIPFYQYFAFISYLPDGTRDSSFGTGGLLISDVAGGLASLTCMTLQPDEKIVAAGNYGTGLVMARYLSHGELDTTFGNHGIVIRTSGGSEFTPVTIKVLRNGKIILTGSGKSNGIYAAMLKRYNANGTLDSSFGDGGTTTTAYGTNSQIGDFAILKGGKIITTGYFGDYYNADMFVTRYKRNGTIDNSFGSNGSLLFTGEGVGKAVVVQPDGKLVVSNNTFSLYRFNIKGTVDSGFGINGKTPYVTFFEKRGSFSESLLMQPDGKLIQSGYASGYGYYPDVFVLARYLNDSSRNLIEVTQDNQQVIVSAEDRIKIMPNPVKDMLHIEGLKATVTNQLFILNEEGKIMAHSEVNGSVYNWNIGNLPTGIYYLSTTASEKIRSNKAIKFVKE